MLAFALETRKPGRQRRYSFSNAPERIEVAAVLTYGEPKPPLRKEQSMADQHLDATGLLCPLPILKAKKALGAVPAGGTLEVLATDPGSAADFEAFCRATGNTLIEHTAAAGVFRFLILKTA